MSCSSSNVDDSVMSLKEYTRSMSIPFSDIESATNNFADECLVTQTSSSKIYKGRLLMQSSGEYVNIVVRKCLKPHNALNEVNILKDLTHKNIAPTLKIFYRKDILVKINEHEANESLDKHLYTLSWMQRLHICVGIARALTYLHYDAEEYHSVIHGNIKSSKILLDHDWEPKLYDFGFAVRAKRNQIYLTDKYNGSLLYMDPAYKTTEGLTHKSDVFSFGVVLFEVLFGMVASSVVPTPGHKADHWYFARMARAGYEEKTLDEKIDPDLRKQMSCLESLNIFSETAYFCLKEQRSQRPDMKKVLQKLERALELQHKHDQSLGHPEGILSNHLKVKNLDHLRFRLSDIRLVTDNFSYTKCIGSGGYGKVYKAKLGHSNGISASTATKGDNKTELPVAIKRLFRRVDGQEEQGFLAEIELLSKCKHRNVVSLLGFCDEEQEMILIYEYASNGSIQDYLENNGKITNLTWAHRIKICIGIAYGLEYLHKDTEDKKCIIHRDIKSANILLDDKWEAKIADFGLSKLHPTHDQHSTLITGNIGGTEVYIDPEYLETGNLKTSSDIYSFGVVLYEIMCGNLAYKMCNTRGLPSIVCQFINSENIEKLVDPRLKEAGLNDGLNHDSLYTFSKIASQCVAKAQVNRPTMEVIIKELEKSLNLQNNRKDNLQISLEVIKLGTQNFCEDNCIEKGRFWRVYEGEILLANNTNRRTPIVAKRFDSRRDEGNSQFIRELKVLYERKHENIVGLLGYCNEMGEKMIVHEHVSNGTLDKHLDNAADLTWLKRLKIGLDVARVLEYLHTGGSTKDTRIIHRHIRCSSILLDGDWRAKLCNFEEFSYALEQKKVEHIDDDNAYGSLSYLDPRYKRQRYLDAASDMYSSGVVLLEMMLGRLVCVEEMEEVVKEFSSGKIDDHRLIFEGIKEHVDIHSFKAYHAITFKCLGDNGFLRPTARELVKQLTSALAYQEDYEIWKPKLPMDYEKLSDMSGKDIISGRFKDIYDMLCAGFFFQKGKAWFSLGSNGKRNVLISAKKFSYTNYHLHKWRSNHISRFQVVAKMLDISNLKVRIKIKPQLLLPGDNYGVHLVFKFREPGKFLSKHMYVNLKYKSGSDNLRSHYATWREDGWMMIELCQILNYKEDTVFEVLLESFSRSHCGSSVYVNGIEFRTIDNEYEEIKKPKEVQHSLVDYKEMLKSPGKANKSEKICFMLSEMEAAPYKSSKEKPFHLKYSVESRFQKEIELSKRQVFGIKGKIESQVLSPDTDYMCHLVFKLSETCHGLHSPVRVRNVLQWKNKEVGLICFRPPSPWNLPDTDGSPRARDDGWMEVLAWKFNSKSALRSNHIPIYIKFITYEGTMSGLIVSGLEVRPM
uniref:uncharacterized protein LOC122581141 isoform X2 n=1 Tax=Erigeron canadensis TaxID=72917 RepID=UPI001CB98437|nr:uncharacterized protein LOC122581141 isoform X2 [Erigeron canadensis]